MSEWDQTGAGRAGRAPGWDEGEPTDPSWQERTMRGLVADMHVFGRRFRLERVLGRGGMGVVWLARDLRLEQEVALKFLPDDVAQDRAALDELREETLRSLRLTHPHIVRVYDFHEEGGRAAIAMEYVDGDTLSNLRLGRPGRVFTTAELLPWIAQACEALDYAHARARVVHRDLKPANLMVNRAGEVRVADFGIARSLVESMTRVSGKVGTSGTLVYMSPQQLDGEPPSPSDDIYSLGATIYELLAGKPPFYSGNVDRLIREKVPPPMAQRRAELGIDGEAIPGVWEAAVAACLEKAAAKRPRTAGEVGAALEGRAASGERRAPRDTTFNNQHSTTNAQGRAEGGIRKAETPTERGRRKTGKRRAAAIAMGLILAAVGGAGWWLGIRGSDRKMARAASEWAGTGATVGPDAVPEPMTAPSDLSLAGQTDKVSPGKKMAPATETVAVEKESVEHSSQGKRVDRPGGEVAFAVGVAFDGLSGQQSALATKALVDCLRIGGIQVVETGFAPDRLDGEADAAADQVESGPAEARDIARLTPGSVMLRADVSFARSQNFGGLISCRLQGAYRLRAADGRDSGRREFQIVGAGFSEEESLRNAIQKLAESELAEHLKRSE